MRRLHVAGFAVLVGVWAVTAALATPPGANGRIAFTRYTDSTRTTGAIFTIAPNGKGERQVTRPPHGHVDFQPDWSRDGTRIVFERQFPDRPHEIWSCEA